MTSVDNLRYSAALLLRTPAFPFNYNPNDIQAYLNDAYFRISIRIASPDLYRELTLADFKYDRLNEKCKTSIWKYGNRIRCRSTPFGLFASFSSVGWTDRQNEGIVLDSISIHVQEDFSKYQQYEVETLSAKHLITRYQVNPSLYNANQAYRYLSYHIGENGNRAYQIDEVAENIALNEVIALCQKPVQFTAISCHLQDSLRFTAEESNVMISELIHLCILVPEPDIRLNITGHDYGAKHGNPPVKFSTVELLENLKGKRYINTERHIVGNGLSTRFQKPVTEVIDCLAKLTPYVSVKALQQFKDTFRQKYDRQRIPLLQALDPETGIGYNGLMDDIEPPTLLQTGGFELGIFEDGDFKWTPAHALLMKKWLANADRCAPILLMTDDLKLLPAQTRPFPNSFSVLFRIAGETIILSQGGGATGTALSGRFSPMNGEISVTLRELAQIEEHANPGVIFAEVSHIENFHTANIERRECFYRYEIPILCGSTVEWEKQIALSDLSLFLINNEIHLWSERLNSRVIPRLSSAYNYLRSDLAVFRFLCDLQHQGIQTALWFDLQHFFPEQHYYPRVMFQDSILSLATWIVSAAQTNYIAELPEHQKLTILKTHAKEQAWPRYVSLNDHDHYLIFDTQNDQDMWQLVSQVKAGRQLLIKEFLFDENTELVRSETGNGFVNEFAATVYHDENIYPCYQPPVRGNSINRMFMPGSEWLYYKLYIHPSASNELLTQHILKCVRRLKTQGLMKQWFFVRYRDPGYHLRIRIKLHPKHNGYALLQFQKVLKDLAASGNIQGYHVDTYERELERYSEELIIFCEDFFCQSSELIIQWLEKITASDSNLQYYQIAIVSAKIMLSAFAFSEQQRIDLFKTLYLAAKPTVVDERADNQWMKLKFRELSRAFMEFGAGMLFATSLKRNLKQFEASIKKIGVLTESWQHKRKAQLISDLLHMHLNRLLVDDSIKQETVLYYCLWRLLTSEAARKTTKAADCF